MSRKLYLILFLSLAVNQPLGAWAKERQLKPLDTKGIKTAPQSTHAAPPEAPLAPPAVTDGQTPAYAPVPPAAPYVPGVLPVVPPMQLGAVRPVPGFGPVPPIEDLYSYCDRSVPILAAGQRQASLLVALGRESEALSVLEAAMQRALSSELAYGRAYTLTGRLLARGVQLSQELHADFDPLEQRELQAFLAFASKWVGLAISVAAEFDRGWYFDFMRQYYGCGYSCTPSGYDITAFFGKRTELAFRQLAIVGQSMAQGYVPFGSKRFFLRLAQRLAFVVAYEDFGGSMYAPGFGCINATLLDLIAEIQGVFGFPDPSFADFVIRDTVDVINWVINNYQYNSCPMYPTPRPGFIPLPGFGH